MADAVELPWRKAVHPVAPRQASVWVRREGRWLRGSVQHVELIDGRWAAWLQHEDPGGGPHARWGLFVADEAIVPRIGDEPPGDVDLG